MTEQEIIEILVNDYGFELAIYDSDGDPFTAMEILIGEGVVNPVKVMEERYLEDDYRQD